MNARVKNYDPDVAEAAVDNCIAGLDAMDEPEVHDCEWEPELSPWHDVKRFAAVVVPLLIAITGLLYALSELREPLSKAVKAIGNILGVPTW